MWMCPEVNRCASCLVLRCAQTEAQGLPLTEGDEDILATIAAVLIILWLLGFCAFHVSTGLIHLALVVGVIVLVLHFMRGR